MDNIFFWLFIYFYVEILLEFSYFCLNRDMNIVKGEYLND